MPQNGPCILAEEEDKYFAIYDCQNLPHPLTQVQQAATFQYLTHFFPNLTTEKITENHIPIHACFTNTLV